MKKTLSGVSSLGPAPLAPPRRFSSARLALGKYTESGDFEKMRLGLGRYIRNGYGGSSTAARRFAGTATTAGKLGFALEALATGQAISPESPLDPALLAGKTAEEVAYAVVEAVRPIDGTQDAEAERSSILDAMTELLTRFPEADLLNLNNSQREYVIQQFTAINVFKRFNLDLGKTIQDKARDAKQAVGRLKEVQDYIRQAVKASFRKLYAEGHTLTGTKIGRVVQNALTETFEVFEAYAT